MKSIVGNYMEDVELLQGQADVFKHVFAFGDSLVLRTVVELRIADIIHAHGQKMSLSQIATKIQSPTLDVTNLGRAMRMLVRKNVFTVDYVQSPSSEHETEALYGLTATSKWLIHDHEFSLAPMLLTFTDPTMTAPWYQIGSSINEGGVPYVKAHGKPFYEMASKDPELSGMFNVGMTSLTNPTLNAFIHEYKDGFNKMKGTLVDVGGNIGKVVAKIVEAYPHIKGINFDQPHIVATAPQYPGVTHVGGDMFKQIPSADTVILKSILVDWLEENCLKILKNCKKAVSEKKGKVIIVDTIHHPDRYEMFDDAAINLDLLETILNGGKQRDENEWIQLLKKAGFNDINIIPLKDVMSVIICNY